MFRGASKVSPKERKQAKPVAVSTENPNGLLSPRFKSVAAMAGWDEEALIIATTVVEDTPDRESKTKKRCDLCFKTPPSTASRRKRMSRRNQNQVSPPIATLNLEEDVKEEPSNTRGDHLPDKGAVDIEEKKTQVTELTAQLPEASLPDQAISCMDKLREELSCAICLEICFEPSTTPCGHSFCKKCLRSAADKCGKRCPKCRQLMSNGRSCTINTVLWNTIKLLFPQEIEARKSAGASPETGTSNENRRCSFRSPSLVPAATGDTRLRTRQETNDAALADRLQREDLSRLLRPEGSGRRRRGLTPNQDEDAALALRLQREELVESFIGEAGSRATTSISLARANLRAMASRAVMVRSRASPSS